MGAPTPGHTAPIASANPDFTVESITRFLEGVGRTFPTNLGIEPIAIDDERSVARVVVDERHLHPGGLVHGGAWTGLGDTVAAWQTFRHIPAGHNFTTIELKLNAFRPGRPGDELMATATHLHAGRSTHVIETRIEAEGKLAANLIVTQFILPAG